MKLSLKTHTAYGIGGLLRSDSVKLRMEALRKHAIQIAGHRRDYPDT